MSRMASHQVQNVNPVHATRFSMRLAKSWLNKTNKARKIEERYISPGAEICFQKWEDEVLVSKSKIEACSTRELHGVGSRGPLKGPGGVQGQSPWRGQGSEAPGSSRVLQHFQCKILSKFVLFLHIILTNFHL